MNIIYIIGFFLPIFYFVLLFTKDKKTPADNILSFLVLALGLHLLNYYLNQEGYWDKYPHLVGLTVPFPLIYAPLMYLYIDYSIHQRPSWARKDMVHFLPFVLVALYMSRFYFFYSEEEKRLVDQGLNHDFDSFTVFLFIAFITSMIYYVVKTVLLFRWYRRELNNQYSNLKIIDLKWVSNFFKGFGLVFLPIILVTFTRDVMGYDYPFNPEPIFYGILALAFIILGFYGIRNQDIFSNKGNDVVIKIGDEKSNATYEHSGLKEEVAREKHRKLLDYMNNEKPYLEPKLSLRNLAKEIEISPNHLSQIINQYEEKNFNDFVNLYRVEEFVERASQNSHLNFLALALDSGFNSKSTFNAVFKKHMGTTPSKYLSTAAHQ